MQINSCVGFWIFFVQRVFFAWWLLNDFSIIYLPNQIDNQIKWNWFYSKLKRFLTVRVLRNHLVSSDKHGTRVASVNNAQIKTWAEGKWTFRIFEFFQMKTSSSLSELIAAFISSPKCKLWTRFKKYSLTFSDSFSTIYCKTIYFNGSCWTPLNFWLYGCSNWCGTRWFCCGQFYRRRL